MQRLSAPTIVDYGLLMSLAVIFGSNFMFIKIGVENMPAAVFVLTRLVIAAVVMLGLAIFMLGARSALPRGAIWWPMLGCALFGYTLPFSLTSWGQEEVDSAIAAIIMSTMPLFTLALAQVFTRDEKPTLFSVLGFGLALVGVVVLFGFHKLAAFDGDSVRQLAIVASAFCFGVNAILTKSVQTAPWQSVTAGILLVSALMAVPFALVSVNDPFVMGQMSGAIWLVVVYAGLVPTALAGVLTIFMVRRTGAAFLSQLNFFVPVVGVFCGVLFLAELLPPNAWLALPIILSGVALARWRPKRKTLSINKGV
ncbi:MAG: DMT family transporter [Pseudomonadota bacterium]